MTRIALVLACLLLTACSGGDSDDAPAPDADSLAAKIGCKGDSEEAPEKVACETEDAFVGITVYENNDARDKDVKAAQAVGAPVLVGDRFMVDASDPTALDEAQKAIGGEVK